MRGKENCDNDKVIVSARLFTLEYLLFTKLQQKLTGYILRGQPDDDID